MARRLAGTARVRLRHSGAIYRAIAGVSQGASRSESVLRTLRVEPGGRVRVDGRDVTDLLYMSAVSERAAVLSQRADVRAFADGLQRREAARGPVVVEGRDAGTVVFPDAEYKFYLDASPDARARRRFAEQRAGGGAADLEVIRTAIAARDDADSTRPVARLEKSADATYVDSSDMTVDEVVELMAKEVERACSTRS